VNGRSSTLKTHLLTSPLPNQLDQPPLRRRRSRRGSRCPDPYNGALKSRKRALAGRVNPCHGVKLTRIWTWSCRVPIDSSAQSS